jgi:hypothetical protein
LLDLADQADLADKLASEQERPLREISDERFIGQREEYRKNKQQNSARRVEW